MYVVLVHFEIKPDSVDAFTQRVCRQARDSLENEPDCHLFDVCVDPASRGDIVLYEVYENKEAFDEHLASGHFLEFDRDAKDWVKRKTVRILERL